MSNPLVRVKHPGIEGQPLVPEKALQHMSPKWSRVDQADGTGAEQPTEPQQQTTVDDPSAAKKKSSPRKRATAPKEKKS